MELSKEQIKWFQETNAKAELTFDACGLPLWSVSATKIVQGCPGYSAQVRVHGHAKLDEAVDMAMALTGED